MKWQRGRRSTNIEDRRGQRASPAVKVGGGIGGIGIVVVIAMFLLGGDPMQLIGDLLGGGGAVQSAPQPGSNPGTNRGPTGAPPAPTQETEFVSVILADTEDTWGAIFRQAGAKYSEPKLILFTDGVQSACGYNTAATGPFYCPPDQALYLDTGFFRELSRMGASGDFAQAYVIGHEVAHHVQNLTGIFPKIRSMQSRVSKEQANALQVLVELQADCYAGVWAHHAEQQRDLLDSGDVEEGLQAAATIGDDRLQRQAGRRVSPESFTHGSSAQRVEWFRNGLANGDIGRCDTFGAAGVNL